MTEKHWIAIEQGNEANRVTIQLGGNLTLVVDNCVWKDTPNAELRSGHVHGRPFRINSAKELADWINFIPTEGE